MVEKKLKEIGKETLLKALKEMVLIRHFETRGEAAYQMGKVGGFFHSYAGEEAIQTAAVSVLGLKNWYVGFYRCHALALLLGATPNELMAELYGKKTGNAKGRGGSMHFYTERMLGGFAIVGGHLPIAIGTAFSMKYQGRHEELTICFLGEGAVAQGAFHESLNLAALWQLPVIFVIENNHWGMGTHVSRALSVNKKIAQTLASSYGISGYTLNGMDFVDCYFGFQKAKEEVLKTSKPILIECECERFKGHSISDPALYRKKEELQEHMQRDPIVFLRHTMQEAGYLTEEQFKEIDHEKREEVKAAMQFAEESPWPSIATLEEDVYARS